MESSGKNGSKAKRPLPNSQIKRPISREGNKALEVERPLFEKGIKIEF